MYHVFTFLSGKPIRRGVFADYEAAKAAQADLHKQGCYFVPVYSTEKAKAEKLLPEPGTPAYQFLYGPEVQS